MESSAHLALHTQSVVLCVTHSAKAGSALVLCDGPKRTVLITWKQSDGNRNVDSKLGGLVVLF